MVLLRPHRRMPSLELLLRLLQRMRLLNIIDDTMHVLIPQKLNRFFVIIFITPTETN